MDDFKAMMKAIEGNIKDIKDGVSDIKTTAKKMLKTYCEDRMEAAKSWGSLSKGSKGSHEGEVGVKKSKKKG